MSHSQPLRGCGRGADGPDALRRANEALERRVAELAAAKEAAESALRAAEGRSARLLAAAESLADGLAIFDAEDRLVFHNARYVSHMPPHLGAALRIGARFEDILRAALARGPVYHPEMGEGFLRRRLADRRAPAADLEFRLVDGRWIGVRETAMPDGGRVLLTSDVTERRAARDGLREREEALRASEARLAAFVANAPVGMHLKDEAGRYLLINAEVTRFSGVPAEAVLGRTAADLVPAEHARRVAAYDREVRETGAVTVNEEYLPGVDGHRWLLVIRFPVRDAEGRITQVGGFQLDITERRAMEEALRASEARLAAFMDHAPVGMYLKDAATGRYLLANPEMGKVFGGRPVVEALGRTAAELFPPEVAAFVAEYDRELVETGAPSVYEQRLTATGRGPYAWSLVIRFPIRDEQGRITQIGGFDVDIGDRRAMEQALQASEQRFRALTEAHPVPVAIASADGGTMLYASPPLAELMGVPQEELIGADVARFYADPSVRPRLIAKLRRDGALRGEEVRMRRGDGTEFWAAFTSKLITFEGVEAMVTGITDLSVLKRAEAEIERQRELLHQNEKMTALGSLLAGVAHELNNPLSVVVAQSAMLRDSAGDDVTRERAAKVQAAAERCARIVRTFLAMARSKPQERGPVRLGELIEAVLDIVAYGLRSGDVEVTLALDPALPPVWGDGDQLGQVLMNLIVNAQQALQGVPPPRHLRIATRREANDDAVAIEIADNGPGIEPETARRIFEPFFTTKPVGAGTGLGLSVCHGIVTAHGGEIAVLSRPREGATFIVRLPLSGAAAADERPAATEAAASAGPPPAAGGGDRAGTILVIDDEPEIGELLAEFLERDGHRVELACSGREALGRLAGRDVDLIVSDLRMPDMDGPALFRELANTRPELLPRIVFLTGDTLAADIQWFLAETGVPVIEKPFDPREVSQRVRRWFGGGGAGPF